MTSGHDGEGFGPLSFLIIDCSTAFSKVNEYIVYMSRLHVNLYILENTKNV